MTVSSTILMGMFDKNRDSWIYHIFHIDHSEKSEKNEIHHRGEFFWFSLKRNHITKKFCKFERNLITHFEKMTFSLYCKKCGLLPDHWYSVYTKLQVSPIHKQGIRETWNTRYFFEIMYISCIYGVICQFKHIRFG